MANATLRKLVTEYGAPGIVPIMEHLENDSGFLRVAQAIPANGNWYHKYKKVSALPEFSFVNIGGSQTDTTVDDELVQIDLKTLGTIQSEPVGVCENWPTGVSGYFKEHRPVYAEAFGQKVSKSVFYGTNSVFGDVSGFRGIHEIAKAYGNVIQRGGTTGSRVSIIAVKFNPISCGLLFNPKYAGEGFLQIQTLNDGKPIAEVTNTTNGAKKLVYQAVYQGSLAFLSSSSYDVAAMTQIDSTHLPTAPLLDELVDKVRGSADGRTILFCNRVARRHIRTLKTTALEMGPMDKDYNIQVDRWNGVPIVLDDNLSTAETTAID